MIGAYRSPKIGNALQTLGERESGTARLVEAVAACRAALKEHTRERVPLDWATTQSNLGVLRSLRLGSGRAGRRDWRRRSRPIAPRWSNGPASAHHIGTTSRNRIWLGILLC